MNGRQTRILPDATTLVAAARDEFCRAAQAAVASSGRFTVALSGGRTPLAFYTALAQPGPAAIPWDRIHFFWGDERHVPPDSAESNYGNTRRALFSRVSIPEANLHPIHGEIAESIAAAHEYERELKRFFKLSHGEPPRFDFVLLGLGLDGHTASLFPGSPAPAERDRLVAAPWIEQFHAHRITLTLPVFNAAARILFLVEGTDKAEIVKRVLDPPPAAEPLPAQLIRPVAGEVLWLLDQAAARLLAGEKNHT